MTLALILMVANLLVLLAWVLYAADEISGGIAELAPPVRVVLVLAMLCAASIGGAFIVLFLVGAELVHRAQRARLIVRSHRSDF